MCFRPAGGVSGIHMSEDNFGQGSGIELRLSRMIGDVWGYHCV